MQNQVNFLAGEARTDMPFRFRPNCKVKLEVRRIAREQVERSITSLDDQPKGRHEAVHDVRRRCKKIRALLRLVRPVFGNYPKENTHYRDVARALSDLRDATTLIECFDALMTRYRDEMDIERLLPMRAQLLERRADTIDEQQLSDRLTSVRAMLAQGLERIDRWKLNKRGYAALRGGLAKTYECGRAAMDAAHEHSTTEHFHEWRKHVKYHRYHLYLLCGCWRGPMTALHAEAKLLTEYLGDDHDLAVLHAMLSNDDESVSYDDLRVDLLPLIERRRAELQASARILGLRLYAEKPEFLAKRLGKLWKAWQ